MSLPSSSFATSSRAFRPRSGHRLTPFRLAMAAVLVAAASVATLSDGHPVSATPVVSQTDITSPSADSQSFGSVVKLLTNGNFVVIDQFYSDGDKENVGAVYLYNGMTNELISTLTGSTANDQIGSGGIVEIEGGEFLVISPEWNLDETTTDVGAVTFVNAIDGRQGVVAVYNSLHGTTDSDAVGSGGVTILSNGEFVVISPMWNNVADSADRAGAVTEFLPRNLLAGPVTVDNSVYGTSDFDMVGSNGVLALADAKWVMVSPNWTNGSSFAAGAVTYSENIATLNGNFAVVGPVTISNSLHGTLPDDRVGSRGVTLLESGATVVNSPFADINGVENAGASTFILGDLIDGIGPVTNDNSLHGTTTNDQIGQSVVATGGNTYAVGSPNWNSPFAARGGAVTYSGGETGITGEVNTSNSLYGTTTDDAVGNRVIATENGGYVSAQPFWDNDGAADVGSVTLGAPGVGVTGPVSTSNSSFGDNAGDQLASGGVEIHEIGPDGSEPTRVSVSSPFDDVDGVMDAGSVSLIDIPVPPTVPTDGLRSALTSGPVTSENSLHGSSEGDHVGGASPSLSFVGRGLTVLANGNLVIESPEWDLGGVADVGAVTFIDVTKGLTGPVTPQNSLHGSTTGDIVANGGVVALTNGNYVVRSSRWDNGSTANVGAATFGNGMTGISGAVSTTNSLHGTTADDFVGNQGLRLLVDGNYTVSSTSWDGAAPDAGAVTFGDGVAGTSGPVTTSNSVIGTPPGGIGGAEESYTSGDSVIVSTFQNQVMLMKVDRSTITTPGSNAAFSSSSPERFVDTRPTGETLDDMFEAEGKRLAGSEYRVLIAGRGNVPVGSKAVVMNVTAIAAEGVGFVTVHPCLDPKPNASSLNYTGGVNLGNEIVAPLSDSGHACLFTSGAAHLAVDVTAVVPTDSSLTPISPARFLDNRPTGKTIDGVSEGGSRPTAGSVITLQVAGRGEVPADARAAIINLTAINASQKGFLTAFPCDVEPPNAASLNYQAGVNRGNEIYASLDGAGRACIKVSSPVNVTGDVVAHFTDPLAIRVGPSRLLDTRPTGMTYDGVHQGEGERDAGSELVLLVGGRPDIPANVATVVINVTAINAEGTGFATVHPCQPTRPNTASLNYVQGVNGGNEVVAEVADGKVCIYTSERAHLTVDIVAAE